ncbi:MAG: type 4a pilus biogenesis protein PilO [Candidatus Methylomirabilales bacterium]
MDIKGLFANTPKRQQYLLLGILGIALVAGWWKYLYQPARGRRDVLLGRVARLQQDIFQKKRISQELPKLEAARKALQADLEQALRRLPEEKEIPILLTQINRLGQEAGLTFSLFKPGKPTKDEFYTRVPIRIRAEGTYHALGRFFEAIGRMERIVNITDLKLDQVDARHQARSDNATITGEFTAMTFTFGGTADEPQGESKAGAKRGTKRGARR